MTSGNNHETLVYRLAQILIKLNQGEKLDPQDLASEFRVNLRTVQRDLNVRFAYLPLQKAGGRYFLDQSFLGKLNTKDIERFASLAGIQGLFPSLTDEFLRDIFDTRIQTAFLVKGHDYEDLSSKEEVFRQLERAIVARHHVAFEYLRGDERKSYSGVAAFKLLNTNAIWYLVGRDEGKLKAFSLSRIEGFRVLASQFEADPEVERRLAEEDGIWLSEQPREIVLKIERDVAAYFKRRKLIANQIIEKELDDGGLIISARVGHPNQILPIVRYWIPNIRIISPEGLQASMERDLAVYLKHTSTP